jgi:ferredoxin
MLDEAYDRRQNSRLSCQLIMSAELNGLRVTLGKND